MQGLGLLTDLLSGEGRVKNPGLAGQRRARLMAMVTGVGILLAVASPSASATTGSIEGVTVESSLAHASVQNLSVDYSGCSAAGDPTCSWDAHAWLVAPPETGCPPNGSWLLLALGHPPGMPPPPPSEQPWLGTREVWRLESTGDGSVQSGLLQLNLEGVNDQFLCLYATEPPASSTNNVLSGARPAYTAEPESAPLLASQLLHVDLPPGERTQPAVSVAPTACKKHRVRRHGKCVRRRAKHRHHRARN
jgi:hypothetical protein